MERKDYQEMTIQVVKLQQQANLLAGSGQDEQGVHATMYSTFVEHNIE